MGIFFPENNPVLPAVRAYFQGLRQGAQRLEIAFFDAELAPKKAISFKVRGNGTVVLKSGNVQKAIAVGTDLNKARRNLRKFDVTLLTALLEVSREKRRVYFTIGHGERNEHFPESGRHSQGMNGLSSLFAERNFLVKPLGIAQGLGREIPSDAAMVAIIAPTERFLPNEIGTLRKYLAQGGRLLVFLEPVQAGQPGKGQPAPKGGASLSALLEAYGLKFQSVPQANDRIYAQRTFTKADRALLVTIAYQSHLSVAKLYSQRNQYPLILWGAGAWQKGKAPPHLVVRETIKGMAGTWGDGNGNFTFEAGKERRTQPILAVAVHPKKRRLFRRMRAPNKGAEGPRILAFSDADLASNLLIRNRANRLVMAGGIAWLAGDEKLRGLPTSEEDVKILHLKKDALVWFYLPVFGVPLLVMGLGFFLVGRPKLGRRRHEEP